MNRIENNGDVTSRFQVAKGQKNHNIKHTILQMLK